MNTEVLTVLRQCLTEQEAMVESANNYGPDIYVLRSAPGLYLRCYALDDWPFCFKPVQIQSAPTMYFGKPSAEHVQARITNQFGDKAEVVSLLDAARTEVDRTQELIDIIEGRSFVLCEHCGSKLPDHRIGCRHHVLS